MDWLERPGIMFEVKQAKEYGEGLVVEELFEMLAEDDEEEEVAAAVEDEVAEDRAERICLPVK